ncbi:MAG: hypothetical protein SV862_12240, partial [Pseudomonadota bacterium]|nr:hypothetical protein [Pseudomonadota bacterium]
MENYANLVFASRRLLLHGAGIPGEAGHKGGSLMKLVRMAALASAVILCGAAANAETFTYITYKPQGANDAHANSLQWLVDEFEKRTGGKHTIQMFWGGAVAAVGETP